MGISGGGLSGCGNMEGAPEEHGEGRGKAVGQAGESAAGPPLQSAF